MTCKNCNQTTNGNFCTHCGQSTQVGKINLPNFLRELSGSVFQVDKGLLYSMKELFVRPGHSIREYLAGKRKSHFRPVAYAFVLSTIYFLISQLLGSATIVNDAAEGFYSGSNGSAPDPTQVAIFEWFASNYAYTMLLLLPVYSLASYLSLWGSGFNYLEHFVLNAYITGQQAILYSLSALLGLIVTNDDIMAPATVSVSVFYTFIVFWQFFKKPGRVALVLRTILTYVLYLLILVLVLFAIFLIAQ